MTEQELQTRLDRLAATDHISIHALLREYRTTNRQETKCQTDKRA